MRATYTTPAEVARILNGETTTSAVRQSYYLAAQAIADAIDGVVGVSFAPSEVTTVGRDYFVESVDVGEHITMRANKFDYPTDFAALPFGEGDYLHIGRYGLTVVKIGDTKEDGTTPVETVIVATSDTETVTELVPTTLRIDGELVRIGGDTVAIGETPVPTAPETATWTFQLFSIIKAPPGVREISLRETVSVLKQQQAQYSTAFGNIEHGEPLNFNQLGGGPLSSTSRRLLKKYEHTSLWV